MSCLDQTMCHSFILCLFFYVTAVKHLSSTSWILHYLYPSSPVFLGCNKETAAAHLAATRQNDVFHTSRFVGASADPTIFHESLIHESRRFNIPSSWRYNEGFTFSPKRKRFQLQENLFCGQMRRNKNSQQSLSNIKYKLCFQFKHKRLTGFIKQSIQQSLLQYILNYGFTFISVTFCDAVVLNKRNSSKCKFFFKSKTKFFYGSHGLKCLRGEWSSQISQLVHFKLWVRSFILKVCLPVTEDYGDLLTSRACRRKVLFSALAHSMHSRHSSTSWPVAASMSRKRSSRERTRRAALALLMEIRKGLTNFSRPPNSERQTSNMNENTLESEMTDFILVTSIEYKHVNSIKRH